MDEALEALNEFMEGEDTLRIENDNLKRALEYVEERIDKEKDGCDQNIKQVVRIALGKEPKVKVTFSNLGKYF